MTPRQVEVLAVVEAAGKAGISRHRVAKALGCTPKTAGSHLCSVMQAGYIESEGPGCLSMWRPTAQCMMRSPALPYRGVASVWDLAR